MDTSCPLTQPRRVACARAAAVAAAALGVAYAIISGYWALGGTALLNTVGAGLATRRGSDGTGLIAVVWVAAAAKVIAAAIGLATVETHRCRRTRPVRTIRALAWITATILSLYGVTLTTTGLLVEAGVVPAAANADRTALRWHAYLWDPWFLIWGALLTIALSLSRRHPREPTL